MSMNVKKILIAVTLMLNVLIQSEAMTVSAMMAMKEMASTAQVGQNCLIQVCIHNFTFTVFFRY